MLQQAQHTARTLRYSKPLVASSRNATSTIHQVSWTQHTIGGVSKSDGGYTDNQRPVAKACTAGAYEADE